MSQAAKRDSVVIIPTYNEKENIANIIGVVLSLPHEFDVLIIDDNSPDGTAAIVKGLIKENPERIHLVERSGKLGLGTAYIAGFKWALERHYEYIIEMDADFSHNPNDLIPLRTLHHRCECGELAYGARGHVVLRKCLCAYHHRYVGTRHHRRICVLLAPRARGYRTRQGGI